MNFGDETVILLEIDQPFCTLTYGVGPCAAVLGTTGQHKCYNTRFTTQDSVNYTPGTLTLRFARAQEGILQYGPLMPSIESISMRPGTVNLAGMDDSSQGLGTREVVTITLNDHLHSDLQVDKYRLERITGAASSPSVSFDPYTRGTFWSKWIARNPYHSSYRCRIYEGTVGQAKSAMRVRNYVIDRIEGPANGQVQIVAKDLFSRLEAQKSVAPRPSKGELQGAITAVAGSATLNPAGIGNTDYPSSGYIAIGDEVIAFTRAGDALTLTTRGALNTTASTHDAEDLVQLVLQYASVKPHEIAYDLLINYAGINLSEIDKTEWTLKAVQITELYTARITEPTPVADLIGELAQQAGFTVWPDVYEGKIKFAALRAAAAVATVNDSAWIVDGSLTIKRQDKKRASQVWVYYSQIKPNVAVDERRNYRSRFVSVDLSSEGTQKYGAPAIREVFSRWIPQFSRTVAQKSAERILAMFLDPPIEAKFKVSATRFGQLPIASYFNLQTAEIQDFTGAQRLVLMAPVEIESGESELGIRAQEVNFPQTAPGSSETIIYIESDVNDVNLRTVYDSLYAPPAGTETVRFIVESGVYVGATSVSTPAIRTGIWPVGVTLKLDNNGRIQGRSGDGGQGGTYPNAANNGQSGGDALLIEKAITLDNSFGQLWGGAGGSGGGAWTYHSGFLQFLTLRGGGGGASGYGLNPGTPGPGGTGPAGDGAPGSSGGPDSAGIGGNGGGTPPAWAGKGGDGAGPGLDGAGGEAGHDSVSGVPGSGGTRGKYLSGNSLVTWVGVGDRRGAVS